MFEEYKDVVTLEEFAEMIRKGRKPARQILLDSDIKYRILRGSYRIPKSEVIRFLMEGERQDEDRKQ